jgi:hypothetical protein
MGKTIVYEMEVETDYGSRWWEELKGLKTREGERIKPMSDEQAIEQAKEIVGNFNDTLRPNEASRDLINVRKKIIEEEYLELD